MDLGLVGRKALICASSKGLGKACACILAKEGCDVILNGRDQQRLETTASEIKELTGRDVRFVRCDISSKEGQEMLLATCPDPDILINNNGGPPPKDFFALERNAIIEGVIQNMITPIELIQAYLPGMIERGFGRIVNITSTSIYESIQGLDLSSGARAGLTSFVAGMARKVVPHNVTINNLLPGPFATDRIINNAKLAAQESGMSVDTILEQRKKNNPAQRFGKPDEFAHACAFLCSEKSGYITGQNLIIDGGAYKSAF